MAFKLDKRDGGSGIGFYLLLALMVYAVASAIIAWQTLDKCGNEHSSKSWQVYPPAWVCE